MKGLIRCAILFVAVLSIPIITQAQNVERLRHNLDRLFHNPKFSNATFGVAIQSLRTGEYLYRLNDTKSLLPASNMKLFTTAEALTLLGPLYKYTTELLTTGGVEDSILHGDLILRGTGDPTFCDSAAQTLGEWKDSLYQRGIRHVDGSVVGDDSYWGEDVYPVGWQVDDLPYYYATQISALNFDGNQISVVISPGDSAGAPATAHQSSIDFGYDTIENYAITGPDSSASTIDARRLMGTNTVVVIGSIPRSSGPIVEQASLADPARYAAEAVSTLLRKADLLSGNGGGRVFHLGMQEATSLQKRELARYISPPLSDIVRRMNKESDNFYAECLFRTVAKVIGGEGSWTCGIQVMRKYLASIGIDTSRVQFTDGSGLSRMDFVTAGDILTVLRAMRSDPTLDSIFYNSLPIMGVDGTLKNHLKGTPAEGNIHAKTGSMTGDRAISGYLTTRDGEPIAFSILINNYTTPGSEGGKLEDDVLLQLVDFSRK